MKIKEQMVPAHEVLSIIDKRLEAVTTQYRYAQVDDRKIIAEAMAETKWQLAELKMQFVDYLTENLDES
jgi:vacuolar-type H+-ATPase subunit H